MISPNLLLFSFHSCTVQKTLNANYVDYNCNLVPSVHALPLSREEERGP